jgi:hypothetical protein
MWAARTRGVSKALGDGDGVASALTRNAAVCDVCTDAAVEDSTEAELSVGVGGKRGTNVSEPQSPPV